MTWEEAQKELIRLLGEKYQNYPTCVEWNLKVMKFFEKAKETS